MRHMHLGLSAIESKRKGLEMAFYYHRVGEGPMPKDNTIRNKKNRLNKHLLKFPHDYLAEAVLATLEGDSLRALKYRAKHAQHIADKKKILERRVKCRINMS